MRENTPDRGVEIRSIERKQRDADDEGYEIVSVAVPVVNPQSSSRDSRVDGDAIVGEIPVTNADTPCADSALDAAAVTVLDERVTAYYPREGGDETVAFVWEAATDDWRCDEVEHGGEFDVGSDSRDADEAVLWERDTGE